MAIKFEEATDSDRNLEKVQYKLLMVTPTMAERMLEHNISNRPIRRVVVEQYAADMRSSRWAMVGDSIKFADDQSDDNPFGSLLDGQHRLKAIIAASIVLPMTVVSGLEPDSQKYMDSGIKRLAADNITMAGLRHGTRLSGVVREVLRVEAGALHGHGARFSNAHVVEFYHANPRLMDAVIMTKDVRKLINLPPALAGCVAFYGNLVRPVQTMKFFERLTARYGSDPHDPAVLLGNRLTTSVGVNPTRQQRLWLTFRALNMDIDGIHSHTRLSLPTGGGKSLVNSETIVAEKNRLLANEPIMADAMQDEGDQL